MSDEPLSEALATYLRLRGMKPSPRFRRMKREKTSDNQPFTDGRDPASIGGALDALVRVQGWEEQLEREEIALNWETIAGQSNAEHSFIETYTNGRILVRCDSTARAHHMRQLRAQFLTKVLEHYPKSGVNDIQFIGPDVPSWSHGQRRVQGRGPRDTYG